MWQQIVVFVATLVLGYLLTPKPKSQTPQPSSDIDAPTAEEGREIPVLFGTRDIRGANIVWYGHLRTDAIRRKGGKK
ncbi:MAG: hypothetical protein GY703_09525 [Gammaproteobacteria bacterium]|nr:hypothetical protein [Gammaproteobacteria bacterium]